MKNSTAISDTDFSKLVKQANLVLPEDQKSAIHGQLDEALKAVDVLNELDTTSIKSTTSASGLTNVFREDVVEPSFSQEEALSGANQSHAGYFVVPAIFESQDN